MPSSVRRPFRLRRKGMQLAFGGKIFLGSLGVLFGGPIGGLIGATLGHFLFDSGLVDERVVASKGRARRPVFIPPTSQRGYATGATGPSAPEGDAASSQTRFVVNLIALAMGLANADGELKSAEVRTVKDLFEKTWRYGPEEMKIVQALMKRFQNGLTSYQIPEVCREFVKVSTDHERRIMVHLLFSVGAADGQINPTEERYIEGVARWLGVPPSDYLQVRGQYIEDSAKPYRVLGLEPGADLEKVKQAYRRLAVEYHPDKVSHLGKELQDFAQKKFIEITQAYEAITARAQGRPKA